jgi:hypothetical protein
MKVGVHSFLHLQWLTMHFEEKKMMKTMKKKMTSTKKKMCFDDHL